VHRAVVEPETSAVMAQYHLFPSDPELPDGFKYRGNFLTVEKEKKFQGFTGKRRVVSFGWRYDFNGGGLEKTTPIPEFLLPLRSRAAAFAALEPNALKQVLVTEYSPGAPIGWHKDRPVFGDVIGISLGRILAAGKARRRAAVYLPAARFFAI
jgi:alkylated DNA repair dioxygenase AlkB